MRRYTLWAGAAVLALAVLLGGWLRPWELVRPQLGASLTAQNVSIGAPAPQFTLPTLGGGKEVSLASLAGRPVLINFWATWCTYCVHEMPLLERIHRQYPNLAVLGVDDTVAESSVAAVGRFARRLGVTYPVLLDISGAVVQQYHVHAYPTSYFVSPQGIIRGAVVGELSWPILKAELGRLGLGTGT